MKEICLFHTTPHHYKISYCLTGNQFMLATFISFKIGNFGLNFFKKRKNHNAYKKQIQMSSIPQIIKKRKACTLSALNSL